MRDSFGGAMRSVQWRNVPMVVGDRRTRRRRAVRGRGQEIIRESPWAMPSTASHRTSRAIHEPDTAWIRTMPLMVAPSVRRRSFGGSPVRRRSSSEPAGLARRPAAKSHTGRSGLVALGAVRKRASPSRPYPPSQAARAASTPALGTARKHAPPSRYPPPSQAARAASTPAPGALAWPKRRNVTSSAARQVITLSRRQP